MQISTAKTRWSLKLLLLRLRLGMTGIVKPERWLVKGSHIPNKPLDILAEPLNPILWPQALHDFASPDASFAMTPRASSRPAGTPTGF